MSEEGKKGREGLRELPRTDYSKLHSGEPAVLLDKKASDDKLEDDSEPGAVGGSGEISDVPPSADIVVPGKMADAIDLEMESVSAKMKALEEEEKLLEKSNELHAMKLALKEKEQKVKKLRGTKPISDIAVDTLSKVTLEKPSVTKAKAKTGKKHYHLLKQNLNRQKLSLIPALLNLALNLMMQSMLVHSEMIRSCGNLCRKN